MRAPSDLRKHSIEIVAAGFGLWLIHAYRWLLDDAFVYFRYVDNWLFLDRGLVYNSGEYTEGYSSQIWPLVLAAPRLLELSYWTIVEVVGLTIGALFFILTMRVGALLAPKKTRVYLNGPLLVLSVTYSTATYFTGGLETPLVQLAAPIVALFILEPHRRRWSVAVALLPLVRPELVLAVAMAIVAVRTRSGCWPRSAIACASLINAAALGLRVWYYADFFPNTYYLKSISNWLRGVAYVWDTVVGAKLHIVVLAAVATEAWLGRTLGPEPSKIRSARRWFVAIAVVSTLYTVRIGGDMLHYRYLAFPFCLVAISMGGWAERWSMLSARATRLAPFVALAAAGLLFAAHPHYLSGHPLSKETRRIDNRYGVSDAVFHRHLPNQTYDVPRDQQEADQVRSYRRLRARPADPARVFRHRACVEGYLHMDATMINTYGLTDSILARGDAPEIRAGHRNLSLAARDLLRLRVRLRPWGKGSFRASVEVGKAPWWVRKNLESIDIIESKTYNDHDFLENLQLALLQPRIRFSRRVREFESGWH